MVAALIGPGSVVAVLGGPAGAFAGSPQTSVVSAVPSAMTPNVNNSTVLTMTQVGSRIIVGGSFTSVSPPGVQGGAQAVSRNFGSVFGSQMLWVETIDALLRNTVGVPMKVPEELQRLHGDDELFHG